MTTEDVLDLPRGGITRSFPWAVGFRFGPRMMQIFCIHWCIWFFYPWVRFNEM